jgi:hypothetical protein
MRRIVALLASLVLSLGVVGPALAQGPQIDFLTITSAVVNQGGTVMIHGTVWCSEPMDVSTDWTDVAQVVGRKDTLHGGFGFQISCNGTTPWYTEARADQGKFAPGWATISLGVSGAWSCDDPNDPNTCYPHAGTGVTQYLKIVRAR